MKKVYSLLSALLCFILVANAQSQMGEIRGKVTDSKTKKPLDYASITIELNGVVKATTLSEDDGSYIVKTLQPGEYSVKVTYAGYRNAVITDIDVISDQISFVNVSMESTDGKVLDEVVIKRKKPIIDPDKRGATKTSKEIMALPQRNANMIANTTAGVDSRAGATPNFRGARADGTAYYVDGVRVYGGAPNLPQNAIDQVQVITGGTPAQYGDFIGGAIAINTKAPSRNWQRGFEFITASPFNNYLDNSNYNELQAFVSGPMKIVNQGKGDKERVLLGFSFAGAGVYARDGRLPATNVYALSEEKQQQLNNVPMVAQGTGFINAGEYLTSNDFGKVDYRQNAASYRASIQGNFSYQPSNTISIRLGYQGEYGSGKNYSYYNSLLNADKNGMYTQYTGRVYLQFTQRFDEKKGEDAKKSFISNAFYTVRLSYENLFVENTDADFGKDVFKYGYLGKFTSYSAPAYTRISKQFGDSADKYYIPGYGNDDTLRLTSYYKQVGSFDTLLTFQQADINTVRGNYTKQVYDVYASRGQRIFSQSQLRSVNGLINGDNPQSVYSSLWGSAGTQQAGYSKSRNETIQLYVMSEASIAPSGNSKNKHDFQFGLMFEQQFNRNYSLGANGLWNLMRLQVNKQLEGGMDESTAHANFDANGVFQDTISFDRAVDLTKQSTFDKNFRNKLISMGMKDQYGKPIDEKTIIDPNSYDPSMFSLDMFSADELLNNGNNYVSYNGYDYLGNRVKGNPGVNKFLNDSLSRTIGAYQPIYTAAWLQDKFVFKDLIVRVGVRMERFDANQVVLKDPYSMVPIYTAGDIRKGQNGLNRLASEIPSSIGDDYAVYVDDPNASAENTTYRLSGYRKGNDWYDKYGNPVTDPNTLWKQSVEDNPSSSINRNTPFMVSPNTKQPTSASFTDYKSDIKFLPRISFSFPISSTSQFFGTYDVLAQRPSAGLNSAQIDDYYYLTYRQGSIIGNPNLRMTQVTDYQMGFSQQIGTDAGLTVTFSYREFRNLLQQYQYTQAWPVNYISYSNIDFSTVKSVGLEYELRDLGNINLSANYLLQFADGTGSSAASSASLIQAGVPQQRNLYPLSYDTRNTLKGIFDYHYKDGKEYDGPVVGGKKIFSNAGVNFIFNYVSGRPYTAQLLPTPEVMSTTNRPQIKGTPNGSRLPSQFYVDMNIDKNFIFRSEGLDGKSTTYRLRIFLWMQNIFNNVNVLGVYRYTGSAYSDGFINSVQAESTLKAATSAQSLVDLYNIRVVDPANFALPRITRIGVALYF